MIQQAGKPIAKLCDLLHELGQTKFSIQIDLTQEFAKTVNEFSRGTSKQPRPQDLIHQRIPKAFFVRHNGCGHHVNGVQHTFDDQIRIKLLKLDTGICRGQEALDTGVHHDRHQ
eukprot:scaffold13527_cov202-Amphora_coffeaeformis.AAC.5